MSVTRYQLTAQNGPFQRVTAPLPTPAADDEVCVRIKAIGLNPLDWKQRTMGIMIHSWPAVLGLDAAGVVESVGSKVTHVKAGDEVFVLCGHDERSAAYQEVTVVPGYQVARKPKGLGFEEVASLPACYLTSASLVTHGLGIPLPHLDPTGNTKYTSSAGAISSILVVGGSSAVGAGAIQLLRLALPHATILTTSSSAHHARLLTLGATACFDRAAQSDPAVIRAATPGGKGVDAVLDAVAVAGEQREIFDMLSAGGPKVYAYPMAGLPIEAPEGIKGTVIFGRMIFDTPGGGEAVKALAGLLERGEYKVPTGVESVGKGFEAIPAALDKLKMGVSGMKLAISL